MKEVLYSGDYYTLCGLLKGPCVVSLSWYDFRVLDELINGPEDRTTIYYNTFHGFPEGPLEATLEAEFEEGEGKRGWFGVSGDMLRFILRIGSSPCYVNFVAVIIPTRLSPKKICEEIKAWFSPFSVTPPPASLPPASLPPREPEQLLLF